MKAQFHKLPIKTDASFLFSAWNCSYFDKPWHFHEEFELVLIEKSKGTKFIGNDVSLFEDGDVFLIGSNIPHLFKNSEDYYLKENNLEARSIFIHFSDEFLGKDFFNLPEMKQVSKLLNSASQVLEFHGKIKNTVSKKLKEMCNENATQRLLSLLNILTQLSVSNEVKQLLSIKYGNNQTTNTRDIERIDKVFEFIMKNYSQEIYVPQVASMFNMSDASFSRYFKHHTRKTFSDYVTEVRINHSCRMLMQGEDNISQISYSSGFENLSNFYRHFKKITGVIPKDYRKRFLLSVKS